MIAKIEQAGIKRELVLHEVLSGSATRLRGVASTSNIAVIGGWAIESVTLLPRSMTQLIAIIRPPQNLQKSPISVELVTDDNGVLLFDTILGPGPKLILAGNFRPGKYPQGPPDEWNFAVMNIAFANGETRVVKNTKQPSE